LTLDEILTLAPVIPVLVIERVEDAAPLARALVRGGLPVLEVTLRTPAALACIEQIARVEGAVVGAGSVLTAAQLEQVAAAGVRFAVSPGFSATLVERAPVPFLPGVATASEAMAALACGCRFAKLFPAEVLGGVALLRALQGPLAALRFCPTGGITALGAPAYLAEPNVVCVGGSWMATAAMIRRGDWKAIETLAREASRLGGEGDSPGDAGLEVGA